MTEGLNTGIPTLAPSFLPEGVKVWVQSENGLLGMVRPVKPCSLGIVTNPTRDHIRRKMRLTRKLLFRIKCWYLTGA